MAPNNLLVKGREPQNSIQAMVFAYTDPTINPRNGAPTISFRSPCWIEGAIADDELMFMIVRESEVI